MVESIPSCRSCGECCLGRVLIAKRELPLPPILEAQRAGSFVLPVNGRCAALVGTLGSQVACVVYERRPIKCGMFEVGGDLCLKYRKVQGRRRLLAQLVKR